jgi:hypothetical protein
MPAPSLLVLKEIWWNTVLIIGLTCMLTYNNGVVDSTIKIYNSSSSQTFSFNDLLSFCFFSAYSSDK